MHPNAYNDHPQDDFEGLSPNQMDGLLRDFLGPGSPLKVREDIPADLIDRSPLLYFIHRLMSELSKKEIKLTPKGNLPGKLVKEYYATQKLPNEFIEQGITKLRGEDDYEPIQLVKHLPLLLGWTKKRTGKLSLTKKGREALGLPPNEFFREVFTIHLRRFNLAYFDGYETEGERLQYFAPYLLYLLHLLGKKTREVESYRARYWRAFPMLSEEVVEFPDSVFESRLFNRFLRLYGLVEMEGEDYRAKRKAKVTTTQLFRNIFRLDPDARKSPPSEDERYEKQLKTALFDAETGGQSWVSDDVPTEMLDEFQARVREVEERQQAGDTTTVRVLLGDMPILPPDEVTTDEIAEREITRLHEALEKRGILTDRPDGFEPRPYYHFLHEVLLPYEVVAPPEGAQLYLPFHEVFQETFDPTELVTESFLLALFNLDEPFPVELLSSRMRLDNKVVSRERGLKHVNDWRARYTRIEPISFGFVEVPGAPEMPPGQEVCFFGIEYVVHLKDGTQAHSRGQGVMELILDEGEWRVSGGMFEGFGF